MGLPAFSHPESGISVWSGHSVKRHNEDNYISVYSPGSLIQDHKLQFNPLYPKEILDPNSRKLLPVVLKYSPRGLLKWKLRKGGRDYKDGFVCTHSDEDCLKKAMDYITDASSDKKRILTPKKLLEKELWENLSTMNKQELILFAEQNSIDWEPEDNLEQMKVYQLKKKIMIKYNYNIEYTTYVTLLEYIEKHLDTFYDDNLDQIYTKEELFTGDPEHQQSFRFHLSAVLNRIAKAMETDDSISGDWFGHFCRSGEPLDIDTLLACQEKYFEPLPRDFFNEDIQFEGVSDKLRRESSLASKSETANFKQTVDELQKYCRDLDAGAEIPGLLSWRRFTRVVTATGEIKDKLNDIHTRLNNGEPVSLEPHEVCFIFQLKNQLQKQGLI